MHYIGEWRHLVIAHENCRVRTGNALMCNVKHFLFSEQNSWIRTQHHPKI